VKQRFIFLFIFIKRGLEMQSKFILCQSLVIIVAALITSSAQAAMKGISSVYETSEVVMSDINDRHVHSNLVLKSEKWFFWRNDKEIEISNADQSFGEKWIKMNKQQIHYQALYHNERFLLDFQPTDLKILGKKANWKVRSTLFPYAVLVQLERSKTEKKFLGYDTHQYKGTVDGVNYQVDWIPELEIPARVVKTITNTKITTELKELYPLNKSPYKQIKTEKYDDMDYADIGDNESHPIVSRFQKKRGIAYFHQH